MGIDIHFIGDSEATAKIRDWKRRLEVSQAFYSLETLCVQAEMQTFLDASQPEYFYHWNTTHNVVGMWKLAGCYEALYKSDGKTVRDIIPALEKAVVHMRENPAAHRVHDSPNGWGTYAQVFPLLQELLEKAREFPSATIIRR